MRNLLSIKASRSALVSRAHLRNRGMRLSLGLLAQFFLDVLILSGDHIYKMNYSGILSVHAANNADCTIAAIKVPMEEASRFGILNTNADGSIYEFEEKAASQLDCLTFNNPPDEEWVDFVHKNRTQRYFTHNHDLVYGPVANDRVYAAFALSEQGLLGKEELIAELRTYRLIDQMLFHTEEALRFLKFIEAEEVRL